MVLMTEAEFQNVISNNRTAWIEVAPKHQTAKKQYWDTFFTTPGAIVQKGVELEMLQKIGINGRNIAHLCCNNGIELLSLKNLGAKECAGFDFSDLAIEEAKQRSQLAGIQAEFYSTNVYEIPETFYHKFDMVYVTAGALGWLPNLELFFKKAASLLARNGLLFIYEIHPLTDVLNDDRNLNMHPLQVAYPYFREAPYTNNDSLDYLGRTRNKGSTKHWFTHTISSICTGIINSDMHLSFFQEYEHDISGVYPLLVNQNAKIPLSYLMIGKK